MSLTGAGWLAFAVVVLVLAVRAVLTETAWRGYRDRRGLRLGVRAMDLVTSAATVTLVVVLVQIVLRFIQFGR